MTEWRQYPLRVEWEEGDSSTVYVLIFEDHVEYADGYEPDAETRKQWEAFADGLRAANNRGGGRLTD